MLSRVQKTRGTRSGFSHTTLMMAMKSVKVTRCVAWIDRCSKVARLLKIVNMLVGWYIHGCPPGDLLECIYHYTREKHRARNSGQSRNNLSQSAQSVFEETSKDLLYFMTL